MAILGNSVLIAGFICSAFSTNTLHLGISIGILIGPAFGLINVNVLLIVNTWFEKKAGLAISAMLTFNCIGKMAVPQLVKFLMLKFTVEQVTFHAKDIFSLFCETCVSQVFMCYAVFCFTGFVGAILMRDVTPLLYNSSSIANDTEQHDKLMKEDSEKHKKDSLCNFWFLINWRLLLDPEFLILTAGVTLSFNCAVSYISQIRNITMEKGISMEGTADILSILGVVEMVGMPLHGIIGDKLPLYKLTTTPRRLIFASSCLGIAILLNVLTTTVGFVDTALVMSCIVLVWGSITVNLALVFAEVFRPDLPSAIGLSNALRALSAPLVGLMVGGLKEQTGNLDASLHSLSAVLVICIFAWALFGCCSRKSDTSSELK